MVPSVFLFVCHLNDTARITSVLPLIITVSSISGVSADKSTLSLPLTAALRGSYRVFPFLLIMKDHRTEIVTHYRLLRRYQCFYTSSLSNKQHQLMYIPYCDCNQLQIAQAERQQL